MLAQILLAQINRPHSIVLNFLFKDLNGWNTKQIKPSLCISLHFDAAVPIKTLLGLKIVCGNAMGTMQASESAVYNGRKKLNRKGQPAISPEEVPCVLLPKAYCSTPLWVHDGASERFFSIYAGTSQSNHRDSCRAHAGSQGRP